MNIQLIKLKFENTCSYKYRPFKYCCEEIQNDKAIAFTDEDFSSKYDYCISEKPIPKFCMSYTKTTTSYEDENADEDEFETTKNYPIQFCPHCGKKIEIQIVDEIDVSERYRILSEQREDLFRKSCVTDSKKEEAELRGRVQKLVEQINDFYELGEWKEDVYV